MIMKTRQEGIGMKKDKIRYTTFKQRAKRVKKEEKKRITTTPAGKDWFDKEFDKLKDAAYWTAGY